MPQALKQTAIYTTENTENTEGKQNPFHHGDGMSKIKSLKDIFSQKFYHTLFH
jgi:hypothetical protein